MRQSDPPSVAANLGIPITAGAAVGIAVAIATCEQPPPYDGPETADGYPIVEGEDYYRTYSMGVPRDPGDPRDGPHIIRVWTFMEASVVEQIEGEWWVIDTRFVECCDLRVSEPASELWHDKQAMMDEFAPDIIPDPPPPAPDPDWGPFDGVPPDWPDLPDGWEINPEDFR